MSIYANNDYIVASNNSMNENKYNADKLKSGGLRALLRPLLRIIKKRSKRSPVKSERFETSSEDEQNSSNESLERRILEEVHQCSPGAAVLVYGEECRVMPVAPEDSFIPVHFARTSAGTFFWTSASKQEADFAAPGHCYTECQRAEQQIPHYADRWVQA